MAEISITPSWKLVPEVAPGVVYDIPPRWTDSELPKSLRGSPRKPTEATETPPIPKIRISPGTPASGHWSGRPTTLHGHAGSPRKPTEAKNRITRPGIRIFRGDLVLEHWYAVPDPLHVQTRCRRKLTEAKIAYRALKHEYFIGI